MAAEAAAAAGSGVGSTHPPRAFTFDVVEEAFADVLRSGEHDHNGTGDSGRDAGEGGGEGDRDRDRDGEGDRDGDGEGDDGGVDDGTGGDDELDDFEEAYRGRQPDPSPLNRLPSKSREGRL